MQTTFPKSKNMRQKYLVNAETQSLPFFRVCRKMIPFILMIAFFAHNLYGQVVINEIMANNKTIIQSNTGKYSDWIELYNKGSESVNIAGWMVSDSPEKPSRYVIPSGMSDSTVIAPNGFMVLWADGNTLAGIRHLPFKLNKKGEFLAIYSLQQGKTVCVDSIRYKAMKQDISFGRKPDGGKNWVDFKKPTPGTKNL